MTGRTARRSLTALASGTTLLGLIAVVPIALIAVAGWPLPTMVPDPDVVLTALQQGNIPTAVVIDTIAVVAWLVWFQLTWAIGWEVVVNGRRLARGLRTVPPPLVPGVLNTVAVRLVSGVLSAGILSGAGAVVALPPTPAMAVTAEHRPDRSVETMPSTTLAAASSADADRSGTWLVTEGDTLWSVAEVALGDGARSGEVLALNPDLGSARSLRPGMTLTLPLGAVVPRDRVALPDVGMDLVEVARGDTLWGLATGHLTERGSSPTDAEVADRVHDVVEANDDVLDDPDLIFPGQVLRFPGTVDEVPVEEVPVVEASAVAELAVEEPSVAVRSGSGAAGAADGPLGLPEESATPPVAGPGWNRTGDAGGTNAAGTVAVTPAPASAHAPVAFGAGATLLAAGALDMVRRRRRYRSAHRSPGSVPGPAPERLATIEQGVLRHGSEEEGPWIRAALASLSTRRIWEGEAVAQPVLARIHPGHLELELDADDPMGAPLPWHSGDGGRTWTLDRGTAPEDLASFHAHPVTPTFVTVGAGVLLNLEAIGVLSVRGGGDGPRSAVRAMVHELATSPSAGTIDIRSTVPIEGAGCHPLVQVQEADELRHELVPWLEDTVVRLAEQRATSAYAGRVLSNGETMSPVVVITDTDGLARLAPVAALISGGGLPIGMVVVDQRSVRPGDHDHDHDGDDQSPVLTVTGQRAVLHPWGVEAEANLLSAAAASGLGELLLDAADGAETPLTVPLVVDVGPGVAATADSIDLATLGDQPDRGDGDGGEGSDTLVVSVLGPVGLLDPTVELTSLQLSLLTYLACHGPSSKAVLVDALWDGQSISRSRFPNVLAEVRSRIGRHHLPELSDGRYRLNGVTTDLARFEAAVERADREPAPVALVTLREALALVKGMPLRPPSNRFWTWVDDHTHLATGVEALVADSAARAARLARESGDADLARWCCEQGLLASPGDETLVMLLTGVYLDQGRPGAARRLVDGWEDHISRLECGEPSDRPRRMLTGAGER